MKAELNSHKNLAAPSTLTFSSKFLLASGRSVLFTESGTSSILHENANSPTMNSYRTTEQGTYLPVINRSQWN